MFTNRENSAYIRHKEDIFNINEKYYFKYTKEIISIWIQILL